MGNKATFGMGFGFNVGTDPGSDISGSGTVNTIPVFTGSQTIGDSSFLSQNSTGVMVATVGSITGTALLDVAGSDVSRASLRIRSGTAPTTPNSGDLFFASSSLNFFGGNLTLSKTASNSSIFDFTNTAQRTYTFPNVSGKSAVGTTVSTNEIPLWGSNDSLITSFLSQTTTNLVSQNNQNITFTQAVIAGSTNTGFLFTGGAHTTLTASTEAIDVNLNFARTVQFATGAITTQRAMVIQAPTYAFVGSSTITNGATLAITGAPVAGSNATITNPLAFWVQSGASDFDGNVGIGNPLPAYALDMVSSTNGDLRINMLNSSSGGSARSVIAMTNDGGILSQWCIQGSGFTTSGLVVANQTRFSAGSTAGVLYVATNSSAPYKWAIGGSATTNEKMQLTTAGLGINTSANALTAPVSALEVNGAGTTSNIDGIRLRQPNVATGLTAITATDVYGQLSWIGNNAGGLLIRGLSDTDATAFQVTATNGGTSTTTPCLNFNGNKKNTTNAQALATTEIHTTFSNNGTVIQTVLGDGSQFFGGTSSPTAYVHSTASVAGKASFCNPSGTAPSSPIEGDFWNDSTQKAIIQYVNSVKQTNATVLGTTVTTATVANTATETTLVGTVTGTLTMPANFLVAGKTIRVIAYGYYSTKASTAGNLTIKVKFGTTVILTTGAKTQTDNLANQQWRVIADITCRTTGVSGTVIGNSAFENWNSGTPSSPVTSGMLNTATVTFDTTGSALISVTAEWGTADTGNTISCSNLIVQVLN